MTTDTNATPIHWRTSLDEATKEAGDAGKLVFLDFFNPS